MDACQIMCKLNVVVFLCVNKLQKENDKQKLVSFVVARASAKDVCPSVGCVNAFAKLNVSISFCVEIGARDYFAQLTATNWSQSNTWNRFRRHPRQTKASAVPLGAYILCLSCGISDWINLSIIYRGRDAHAHSFRFPSIFVYFLLCATCHFASPSRPSH